MMHLKMDLMACELNLNKNIMFFKKGMACTFSVLMGI